MNFTSVRWITFIMITLPYAGCGSATVIDITTSAQYKFSAFSGKVLITKTITAIAEVKDYMGKDRLCLLPPKYFDKDHPQYTSQTMVVRVIEELPKGVQIKISRLLKDTGKAELIMVTATLADGRELMVTKDFIAKNKFLFVGVSNSEEWSASDELIEVSK